MHLRKLLMSCATLAVVGIGWYLFRPERLVLDRNVNEDLPAIAAENSSGGQPAPQPVALFRGEFHSVAHQTTGVATIYRLAHGKHLLRLMDFTTSDGPDVHVYLVAAADAHDSATVARSGFVTLGPLKGNIGNQNYELPAGVDLTTYRAVTIWCKRFSVNFATAPLQSVP